MLHTLPPEILAQLVQLLHLRDVVELTRVSRYLCEAIREMDSCFAPSVGGVWVECSVCDGLLTTSGPHVLQHSGPWLNALWKCHISHKSFLQGYGEEDSTSDLDFIDEVLDGGVVMCVAAEPGATVMQNTLIFEIEDKESDHRYSCAQIDLRNVSHTMGPSPNRMLVDDKSGHRLMMFDPVLRTYRLFDFEGQIWRNEPVYHTLQQICLETSGIGIEEETVRHIQSIESSRGISTLRWIIDAKPNTLFHHERVGRCLANRHTFIALHANGAITARRYFHSDKTKFFFGDAIKKDLNIIDPWYIAMPADRKLSTVAICDTHLLFYNRQTRTLKACALHTVFQKGLALFWHTVLKLPIVGATFRQESTMCLHTEHFIIMRSSSTPHFAVIDILQRRARVFRIPRDHYDSAKQLKNDGKGFIIISERGKVGFWTNRFCISKIYPELQWAPRGF